MRSILFGWTDADPIEIDPGEPACFHDLNLDQVVAAVTAGKREYDLVPFFHEILRDPEGVRHRHEVFRDLENDPLFSKIKSFEERMRRVRRCLVLAEKVGYRYQRERWLLDAIDLYGTAASGLSDDLAAARIVSWSLAAFRDHLHRFVSSDAFRTLREEAGQLKDALSGLRYNLVIDGLSVRVTRFAEEEEYTSEIERTFEKFRKGSANNYLADLRPENGANHVEEQILGCLARLFPEVFSHLDDFCCRNGSFLDATLVRFDREIQFYVAWLEYTAPLKAAGLAFCYPALSGVPDGADCDEGFDIALAAKLVGEGARVVVNGFHLRGDERVIVVTGPNQGGKTTFARAVGQLFYLAALGCPVPGTAARLFLPDTVFTHFEREERVAELRGRLEDDLLRVHAILERATDRSVVIMNEIFTSTTIRDAVFLGSRIIRGIFATGPWAVLVTFLDELAAPNPRTVSMVAGVDPANPELRTFRIDRAAPDGLAYALALAARHRLTCEAIRERVGP